MESGKENVQKEIPHLIWGVICISSGVEQCIWKLEWFIFYVNYKCQNMCEKLGMWLSK